MAGKEFLSKDEAYLFNHGKLNNSYVKFGAQVLADGVHFAVWAPHASRVSVVGDFNGWNGSEHKMSLLDSGDSGVWVLFIPDLGSNELYKYEICGSDGSVFYKADPFAFFSELRPDTASITYSLEGYKWSKAALAFQKRERNIAAPMLIYEVHLGSWMRHADGAFYTYRDLADKLVPYVQEKGYTHLEVMPLMEHPLDASWGYQITGYFSATSRYGNPHDLMYFIDKCHQAGLGVIMDWVPGHFCRDSHGLGRFDGEALYDGGDHANWGTYRFNFLRAEVWSFLISNAFFWFDVYKVDGLRVDGVTSMIYANFGEADSGRNVLIDEKALEFIRTLNDTVAESFPHVLMFAEESTDWPRVTHPTNEDGLGFHYKWNMGWMNDTLRYSALPFTARPYNHDYLTFSFMYAFSENFILPFSHDEVVHGKRSLLGRMPGDYWQKFAGLRALYCYYLTHPGKKLCFMGTELAPFIEWRYDEELEWFLLKYEPHQMFQDFVTEANLTYRAEEALWVDDSGWLGFDWIDADNRDQSVFCFLRYGRHEDDHLLVVLNMSPDHHESFRVGVPVHGLDEGKDGESSGETNNEGAAELGKNWKPKHDYVQLLCSDEERFGGSGKGNQTPIEVKPIAWQGRPASIEVVVPPLAGLIFKPVERKKKTKKK